MLMDDEKLERIVDDLYILFPLFRKKLFKHGKNFNKRKIPHSQYHVLRILNKRGELSMSEIGRLAHIHKSNMTTLSDKLVREGLAERLPNQNDRRIINLSMTERGNQFLHSWKTESYQEIKNTLSTLSEEDLETLYQSVENIKVILGKID